MPSYIEIDQNLNFPSSSGAGKVIFGVNTSGEATITDNTGNTSVIGSGGGNTPPTPTANDFIDVQSYSRWIYGLDDFGSPSTSSKWDVVASEIDQSDYLKLTLVGGQVNGVPVHRTYISASVDYTNLTYRDDGFGSFPVNYVDFINNLFASHSIYTRITGSTVGIYNDGVGFTGSYCAIDNFVFVFLEQGVVSGSNLGRVFYSIGAKNGLTLFDGYSNASNTVFGYVDTLKEMDHYSSNNNFCRPWYQPSKPGIESGNK